MNAKKAFDYCKHLKTSTATLQQIVEIAPIKIAYGIKAFRLIDNTNKVFGLTMDRTQLSRLQADLGNAILNDDFDQLDDIIINFFTSYYCNFGFGSMTVSFSMETVKKFRSICDNFKGKKWDDIVESFFDSLYEFMLSGNVGPYKLID